MISFKITIPTDEGFIGRQCKNPDCNKYFRIYHESIKENIYCPYCGVLFEKSELNTADQSAYFKEAVLEKAKEHAFAEIDKMFGNLARQNIPNKFVKFKHKPIRYCAKPVYPKYEEKKVDSELTCPECNSRFQVYGIFGFCPVCKNENILIYDANLDIINHEIESAIEPDRALRHAYSDLVSSFEIFCKKKAKQITTDVTRFQILFETRRFFKQHLKIDILSNLKPNEELTIRRIFQKRHSYEHNEGMITEKYIKNVPEDKNLLRTKAILSKEEFNHGAKILRKIIDNLISGFKS